MIIIIIVIVIVIVIHVVIVNYSNSNDSNNNNNKWRKEILKHIYNSFWLIITHSKAMYKLKVLILKYPDSRKMF